MRRLLVTALVLPGAAMAQETGQPPQIVVTAPGGTFDEDDAVSVGAGEIARAGAPDMFGALARSVPGASFQDAQGDPWQPNLVYHGYVASPLQGSAQGFAVYLDGARFNQPFGDTVQFDLLPEAAIETIEIKDASPVYGLNALGGAIVVSTKTGRSAPGLALSGAGGRFGQYDGAIEAGWAGDRFSAYTALQAQHDDGWRRFSPSTLYNGYADLGWEGSGAGVHLKLVGADTDLTGNGTSPVELLAADRRAVFTHPDTTRNRYRRIGLHPWAEIGPATRIEASLYAQMLRQRTVNGDAADIEGCENTPGLLCLEDDDGDQSLLRTGAGATVADLGEDDYGVLNRSRTRTSAAGALVQLVDRRALLAGENVLTVGFSHDRSRTRFGSSTELGELREDRGVEGLGPLIDQPDGVIAPISLTARTRYWGLFLADRLPLAPGLSAELGLRWNHARVELDDRIGTALDGRHRFRRLNPGIELDWQAARGLKLNAGYAESGRAPTPAELSCASEEAPCSLANFFVADPPLKQVVARTWSAGASGRAGAFEWRLSGWRSTSSNDIQFVAADVRGRAFFRNVGDTRRQGVDASLGFRRGPWAARAGYAFTDATFRDPLIVNSPDNPQADEDGTIAVAPGDRLPGIPRHRAILSLDYAARGWSIGGDVQAASGQYLYGDEANLTPKTGSYVVASLRGSVALFGPVTLFGEVRNLFDRKYETFGTFSNVEEVALAQAPTASDPRSLAPAVPRRWLAGLKAKF